MQERPGCHCTHPNGPNNVSSQICRSHFLSLSIAVPTASQAERPIRPTRIVKSVLQPMKVAIWRLEGSMSTADRRASGPSNCRAPQQVVYQARSIWLPSAAGSALGWSASSHASPASALGCRF